MHTYDACAACNLARGGWDLIGVGSDWGVGNLASQGSWRGLQAAGDVCTAGYRCERSVCMPTAARMQQAGNSGAFNAMLRNARARIGAREEA
jgi:hypothetical protein